MINAARYKELDKALLTIFNSSVSSHSMLKYNADAG